MKNSNPVPLNYMEVRFLGLKIGETCVLCCDYNSRYWDRAKQLRYQEAFWSLRWWVRVLILFNIITLKFNRDFDYDCLLGLNV